VLSEGEWRGRVDEGVVRMSLRVLVANGLSGRCGGSAQISEGE
jgi:hypothetical protein